MGWIEDREGGTYLRFNARRTMHIFLRSENERMENDMFGRLAKQRGRRMHVDGRAFNQCLIPLLRILSRRIPEEAATQRLPDLHRVAPTRHNLMLIALHDGDKL